MYDVESKIKFYGLGIEKTDISKIKTDIVIDTSKKINASQHFSEALRSVIQKDIDFLSDKIFSINNEITKRVVFNGVILDSKLDNDVENIDSLINEIEILISGIIIDKSNIKLGIFSPDKKLKKEKIKKLEEMIEYLSKCQNDFISIKNEYNKLIKRNALVEGVNFEQEKTDDIEKEDPLERTINFYMKKQERN